MRRNDLYISALVAASLLAASCASTAGGAQAVTLADGAAADMALRKVGGGAYRIQLRGKGAPSRAAVENRLAYEATAVTLQQRGRWFEVVSSAAKASAPRPEVMGKRSSFRMENWRPSWRLQGAKGWTAWAPAPGETADSATAGYEASIDIVVHNDRFDGINPLGFDAYALNDYIRPQTVEALPK